jgi:hypothetical protein
MQKKYNKIQKILVGSLIIILVVLSIGATAQEYKIESKTFSTNAGNEYKGALRIYIVEIESRWKMEDRQFYHNALYDFAFNDEISIRYLETYEDTIIWSGDVVNNNVIVMAALFNENGHTNYADPPDRRPFTAHYVDAAAGAKPGETSTNTVNEDFTHTVFLEKGTATWCPSCPKMAYKLKSIYEAGDFPFYYVSMVIDESSVANRRMNDFSLYWLPTGFYDGGTDVVVGGSVTVGDHIDIIKKCGKRDVHELDLKLSVETLGQGELEIQISITNNEAVENNAPDTPIITGPEEGITSEDIEFTVKAIDPDGDDIFLCFDWGDGSEEECLGPYLSGEDIIVAHNWTEDGIYIIKVKAKDLDNAESNWATTTVTMPKIKTLNFKSIFNNIIKKHPKLFDFLEKIFNI